MNLSPAKVLASNKPADIGEYQANFIWITVPGVLLTYSGVFWVGILLSRFGLVASGPQVDPRQ